MPGTTYTEKYDRSLVMDRVKRDNDGWVLDYTSQVLLDICNFVTSYDEYVFREGDRFPTLVYKAYGTTTIGWIVIYYNGLMSPLELIGGMTFRFPNKEQVDKGIELSKKSISRSVVVI